MFVCVYIYIASFFLLIGHLHSGDVPNVCFRVFKEVSVEYIHTSGSWLVVVVGCHGWLSWLVVMALFYLRATGHHYGLWDLTSLFCQIEC